MQIGPGISGHRVAVTGVGAVSCAGAGSSRLWEMLCEEKSRGSFNVPNFSTDHLGGAKDLRRLDPFALYALAASDEAWQQSGLEGPLEDAAVIMATGIGGLQSLLAQVDVLKTKGASRVSPFMIPMMMPNAGAAAISMRFGLGGPCETIATACAAGTHAIGYAARLIASGRSPVAVCGGSEAVMTDIALAGFANMTALSTSGLSRPFDRDRDGFVMGEGAGTLVLEQWDHAVRRGAPILAEIVGASSTADAHHITAPDPEARGAIRSMRLALQDAGIGADEIDHVNCHGTSTPLNDQAESQALRSIFGARLVPVTSNKGHLGHSLAAAGALEAIATVMSLLQQLVPPTAGTTHIDPQVALDVVITAPRKVDLRYAMSNSFGFGGHNGTLIIKSVNQ
ncbi:MAG: beta-ketoacyl-[acyl-carrier-protein] synthase family protein [Actinomycetota bacterium]